MVRLWRTYGDDEVGRGRSGTEDGFDLHKGLPACDLGCGCSGDMPFEGGLFPYIAASETNNAWVSIP